MSEEMLVRAEEYLARRRHRMCLLRAVTAMALVVAMMTSYVLMLPGLTLQAEAYCGLNEHIHTDSCYTLELVCGEEEREPSETVLQLLQCAFKPHVHTDECRTPEGEIVCGISKQYWHRHSAECYNEAGEKVCTLVSNPKHRHSDACYELLAELICEVAESDGHQHDAACYTPDRNAEPICGKDDKVGHLHSERCYVTNQRLVCEIEIIPGTETGDHRHTEECTVLETHLVCPLEEDGHAHSDACYPISEEPTCGLEVGEGAHSHTENCCTYTRGELVCPEQAKLHEHSSACYDPETGYVICGELYMQEHNHSAACLQPVTAVEEGHTHSDECYVRHYSCTVPEHVHDTSCYEKPEADVETPQEPENDEVVSTTNMPTAEPTAPPEATPEPTAEPEVTAEPTATPEATAEPTAEPEATAEPTATPEATAEPTAEPEATAEPTATPEATAEPTAEPEVTVEPTAAPSLGPVLDVTTPAYSCGLVAHVHSESCYAVTGVLTCGYEQEHEHDLDCQCVCGDEEHCHTDACYNDSGEVVCGIEEHRHIVTCALDAEVRETEADITAGRANFADYIADSKWNTSNGVSIAPGAGVEYNPETDSFETKLEISFAIPNYVLRGYSYWNGWFWVRVPGQQEFYYEIPEEIKLTDSMIDKPFPITSPDGKTIEGTFYIRQTDDGTYYLEIEFSDDYVRTANAGYSMPGWPANQTPYSQGSISFGCEIGSNAAKEDGSIRIEFTTNDVLEIPPKEITYPDNETATANISTEKRGSYVREGNKLYYTVLVHSDKGTPDFVKVEDRLTIDKTLVASAGTPVVKSYTSTWNGYGWSKNNDDTTVSMVQGTKEQMTATTGAYKADITPKNTKYDLHLPKIADPGEGKRFTYEITYEIDLNDLGLDFQGSFNNEVKAKSETGPDNKVEANANSSVGIYIDSLAKVGSYDQTTDRIKWSITVNSSNQDIAGAVLTDEMFTDITKEAAPDTIVIKDASGKALSEGDGYLIHYENGTISYIEFLGTSVENGVEVNRNKYVIEYFTTPSESKSEYTETNEVKLTDNGKTSTETGGAYVKRDLRIYKQKTDSKMDGTDRLIDWKAGFTVYDGGLAEDLVITDSITGDGHYMSAEQVKELYKQVQGEPWFSVGAKGAMTLTYKGSDGSTQTVSAKEVYDAVLAGQTTYDDYQFTGFTYTIYKDELPDYCNGETIEITYQTTADTAGLNGTANYYNGWGVGNSNTGANDQYTYTEIIKVDKLNYWDSNDEPSITTTTGIVEWHVHVTQDKTYNYLKITDTLPPETKLNSLKFGPYGDTKISLDPENYEEDQTAAVNLVVTNPSYHERGVTVTGTYVPSTGVIELTVTPAANADEGALQRAGFGAGQTFKLKVFAELKDQYMNLEAGKQGAKLDITNKVNVSTNEGGYGNDEHTYHVTPEGVATVTKTDGNYQSQDTSITTESGELTWRVNVYQKATYNYLEIVDTLPEGVELVNVKLGRYTERTATYDATTATDDGTCELKFSESTNDKGLKYSGTYNVKTRVVTIRVEPDGSNTASEVFGDGKTFTAVYKCQVDEALMPKTEDGEYVKKLGALKNDVQVNIAGGTYGSDSQTQTVTIEKEKPVTETVGKNHNWTPSMNLLEYTVDLNPTAADLDPSKNMLTVTDKLTYYKDPEKFNRQLSLIKSTVKLFYADYDANGVPLRDENGRLIKGQEVPYSDWTMTYTNTEYENGWQQSDCTMVLTVPDERALVLEYDYRVSMNYVPGADNSLFMTNTVSITGYDEKSNSTDWSEKWEEYNAGGIVSTERSLSVVKFDASNHAKLIEGAEFTVYEYSSETNTWTKFKTYNTDANGNLMVQWQQEGDTFLYKENTAYKIVETQPALGYILDPTAKPIYFYWANATVSTSSLPDNWATEYNPRELVTNPGHVEVDNIRRTTEVAVKKIWNVEDKTKIPDKLTVHLKRYAVPKDVWEAHPEYNHGLSADMVSVTGELKTGNANNFVPSFELLCYAGSTVSFDLTIPKSFTSDGWGNGEPVFNNLTAKSRTIQGEKVVYHYEMVVTESVALEGWFNNTYDGAHWSSDWNWDKPSISNVTATVNTGDGALSDSDFTAELDQYRDRNYTNTMTLTADGEWEGLWQNLDLVGEDANEQEVHYKYYVVEDLPNGFAGKITGGSSDISGSFEITNTYDESRTETTSVKVVKIWQDDKGDVIDPLLDAVEVRLYQKDELTGREIVYPYKGFATTVINEATEWSFFFRDLPYGTWDKDGNVTSLYSYRIEEVTKDPNFVTQIIAVNAAGVEVLDNNFNGSTVTIINAERHRVSVTVYKEWEDGAAKHTGDKITVKMTRQILTQDGYVDDSTFTAVELDLSAANNWAHTWSNLDDASATGDAYRYVVKETHVNGVPVAMSGYIPVYSSGDGSIPNDGSMTITNELPDELKITKQWTNKEGNKIDPPAGVRVTMKLCRTTEQTGVLLTIKRGIYDPGTEAVEELDTFILDAECGWTKVYTGLPSEALSGEAYHYYVKEVAVEGYETKYTQNHVSSDGEIIVTNIRDESDITYITINKQWTDLKGAAMKPDSHQKVYFKLLRNDTEYNVTSANEVTLENGYIVVDKASNWTLTIKNLPTDGTYSVVEYRKEGDTYVQEKGATYAPATGTIGTSFNVTNRLTEITVEKVWKDVYGKTLTMDHSKTVTLTLMRIGSQSGAVELQKVTLPIAVTGEDGTTTYQWSTTIRELLAGDKSGELYTYYFVEETVPEGFAVTYSTTNSEGNTVSQQSGTITVTNTQEDVSFGVEKVWKDKSGKDMTPPDGVSIAINLMRVGTATLEIKDENGNIKTEQVDELIETIYLPVATVKDDTVTYSWEAEFTGLPKTDLDGKAYQYYIVEGASTGMTDYTVTYSPASSSTYPLEDGVTVTVTNQLKQKNIKINVMKRWTSGSTAKEVQIDVRRYILDADGNKIIDPNVVKTLTFKVDDTAAYQTVTDLPDYGKFTVGDKTYTGDFHYYVEELGVTDDYTVTYSNDDGKTTVINAQEASLHTDGNLRVINHERAKLNVKKVWDGVNAADSITFELWRREIPASAIENEGDDVEFVDVTFRIVTPNGEDVAVLSSVTKTFRKGAQVTWNPTWASDWTWHPDSSEPPQTIVYTTKSGTSTTIAYSDSNHTNSGSRYTSAYSFNVGYMVESGTITWTTNSWYQSGGSDNGLWSHGFVVDGKSELSTYGLRSMSRAVGDEVKVGSFTLDGTAGNWTDTSGATHDYEVVDGNWSMLFYDLPLWNADKTSAYVYYVVETAVGTQTENLEDSYTISYTNNSGVQNGEITITNSAPNVTVARVTVKKAYVTNALTKPDVEITLFRSVTGTVDGATKTFTESVATITLPIRTTADGNTTETWEYTWDNLLVSGSITQDGKTITGEYTYSVKESVPTGFTVAYSSGTGETAKTDGTVNFTETKVNETTTLNTGEVTITNTQKTGLTVKKVWDEEITTQPEIEFALKRVETLKSGSDASALGTVDVTFQVVVDYEWESTTNPGTYYPKRDVLSTMTKTFTKGSTVVWNPTWHNGTDNWHPTSGTVTFNGQPVAFKQPTNDVDNYTYSFFIGQVNEGGTVIWVVDNWYQETEKLNRSWSHDFNANAGNVIGTYKLNEDNGWQMTFYDLPAESADQLYDYTYEVEELTEGYAVTYDTDVEKNETLGEVEGNITITNAPKPPETTQVSVEKKYITTDTNPPAVKVQLKRSITAVPDGAGEGAEAITLTETVGDVVTLDASKQWKHTWSDLYVEGTIKDEAGNTVTGAYQYHVEETNVPDGYEVSYSRPNGNVPSNGTVVITNRELTQVEVEKQWVNQSPATAPEISFNLIQVATPTDSTNTDMSTYVTVTFNIVQGDNTVAYETVTRKFVKGSEVVWYPTHYGNIYWAPGRNDQTETISIVREGASGSKTLSVSLGDITTTNNPVENYGTIPYSVDLGQIDEDTVVTWRTEGEHNHTENGVRYYWTHSFNPAGESADYIPANVTRTTMPGGPYKLNSANDWKMAIGNLPTISDAGKFTYTYLVEETNVPSGFTVSYSTSTGVKSGNITITNERELISITAKKTYVRKTDIATPAVEVQLVRSITQNGVTLEQVAGTAKLSSDNNWQYTWTGLLPSGSIESPDGTVTVSGEFTYFVRETVPLGFNVSYSPNEDGSVAAGGTVTITNTEQTQLKVEKVWGDNTTQQEIEFKLWRKRVVNEDAILCPNKCGKVVTTLYEHRDACGHYTCEPGYKAEEHAYCPYCYDYVCDGDDHGECPYCVGHMCDGTEHGEGICDKVPVYCDQCGEQIKEGEAALHIKAPCGTHYICCVENYVEEDHSLGPCGDHYACEEGYVAAEHAAADCGQPGHYKCDWRNHTIHDKCNGYYCVGEHGADVCYCPDCGAVLDGTEHNCGGSGDTTTCLQCGQTITNPAEHEQCSTCKGYLCDDTDHSSHTCSKCGHPYSQGGIDSHMTLATCGVHYKCVSGDHGIADCQTAGHYKCDGQTTHYMMAACNKHRLCVDGYNAAEHALCKDCQQGLCQDVHSNCKLSIDFTVYDKDTEYQYGGDTAKSQITQLVPKNSTVTWTIRISNVDSSTDYKWENKEYSYNSNQQWRNDATVSINGNVVTVVVTFTASSDMSDFRYYMNWNSHTWTVEQSVNYAAATSEASTASLSTMSLRSTSTRSVLTSTPRAGNESQTVNTTGATNMGTYVLNAENGWEHIFYELPQYSEDGKYKYEYFVEEVTTGYVVSYENNDGVAEGQIKITNNKREPTTKNVTVTKEWVDESRNKLLMMADTPRYFKLLNNGVEHAVPAENLSGATLEGGYIKLVTPQFKSGATFTILNLPISGSYELKEYMLLNGEYVEVKDREIVADSNNNTFTVTNKMTDITIDKVWAPNAAGSNTYVKPAVTFELWRTDGATHELVGTKVMNAGVTRLTWDQLPLTKDGTTKYQYYVKEQVPSGFTAANGGQVDVEQGTIGTITNTPTELKVQKQWENLEGTTVTRTDGTIYYNLMRQKVTISNGVETLEGEAEKVSTGLMLTKDNNWMASHTGLPVYWSDEATDKSGQYRYSVVETDKDGNILPATYSNTSADVGDKERNTITITNTETAISVRKIWSNNGGALPSTLPAITLQLRCTREEGVKADSDPIVATVTLRANSTGVTVTTQNGNVYWLYTWEHLPAYDLVNGEKAARYYYVVEVGVPDGFRQTAIPVNNVGILGNTDKVDTIEITNELITYELPETGGAGTTPYTACGILLMFSALTALMYIELKRKKQWGEGRES